MSVREFALKMLAQNPNIAQNPNAKHMIEIIQSGDSQAGEQFANNLCSTMGVSKEEALSQAKRFFGLR